MPKTRLGQLEFINCLPIYHGLEQGLLPLRAELVKGPPTALNQLFMRSRLDISPVSSIAYARNSEQCLLLPDLSISADGPVMSVLLFSKVPVTELEGKKVCLSRSSATGATLLKLLFDHYYHVQVDFGTATPDLGGMLAEADGALLIGDKAMQAHRQVLLEGLPCHVTDLGAAWKSFTGFKMIYAVWVVREDYAKRYPEELNEICKVLLEAKEIGLGRLLPYVIAAAEQRSGLPLGLLEDYFHTIKYDFSVEDRKALLTFYDYAYKSGLIDARVQLRIWGEAGA